MVCRVRVRAWGVCLLLVAWHVVQATNTIWAIKMLKKAEVIRLQQVEHMISEKTILQTLDHPFIVSLGAIFQGAVNEFCVLF